MKKILLNILTHGDEYVGKKVAEEIAHRYPNLIGNGIDIQIANIKAFESGKRYIDADLNRVFPGKKDGSYEEKRAYEISQTISEYELVVDIHSTESGSEDIVIITKIDAQTKKILSSLSPRQVLFMNIGKDTSLISQAKIGVAFEMGKDADAQTFLKTIQGIEYLLHYFNLIPQAKPFGFTTKYFEVFSQIEKPNGAHLEKEVENFSLIKKGQIFAQQSDGTTITALFDFYPVIFGNTNYETIFGFAAKEIKP